MVEMAGLPTLPNFSIRSDKVTSPFLQIARQFRLRAEMEVGVPFSCIRKNRPLRFVAPSTEEAIPFGHLSRSWRLQIARGDGVCPFWQGSVRPFLPSTFINFLFGGLYPVAVDEEDVIRLTIRTS